MSGVDARPPTPSKIVNPLLKVLGQKVALTPNRLVHQSKVLPDVIRELGFDPDNLPEAWRGGMVHGDNGIGLRRQIGLAFRSLYRGKVALAITGAQKGQTRGYWGLTEAGVRKARSLNEQIPKNETALWFDAHLTPAFYNRFIATVSYKLPASASMGLAEDHVHEFIRKKISTDAFAKHLTDGKTLPESKVLVWCTKSARSDVRNLGTNPVCREIYGARTQKEREDRQAAIDNAIKNHEPVPTRLDVSETPISWDADGNIIGSGLVTDEDAFLDTWENIERVVTERQPHIWEDCLQVLTMRVWGYTVGEIAKERGETQFQTVALLKKARKTVREAMPQGPNGPCVPPPSA